MPRHFTVRDSLIVHAPAERIFSLSTRIELVQATLQMRPVAGRTSGFVLDGDTVLWRGFKWGLPQFHLSLIEALDAPRFFRDRMLRGRFRTFAHDHHFEPQPGGAVLLRDEIRFTMPWGWAGELAGRLLVEPHARSLLRRRFALLRDLAEGEGWRAHLS